MAAKLAPDSDAIAKVGLDHEREAILEEVAQDGLSLAKAGNRWRANKDVVIAAVGRNGLALRYAAENLRASKEVVMVAVASDGLALQFASETLRARREVVLAAVKCDGLAIEFAAEQLQADREIVLVALVEHGPDVLLWAPDSLAREYGRLPPARAAAMLRVANDLALANFPQAEVQDDAEDVVFTVTVLTGAPPRLGLTVASCKKAKYLEVSEVREGLIHDWNAINASSGSGTEVKKGDRIIKVNGVGGNPLRMMAEVRPNKAVEITLQRRIPANACSAGSRSQLQEQSRSRERSAQQKGTCVICMDAPAVITFVHGSTGHTAACLICASGLPPCAGKCPVCRQTYSLRIQNFNVG
mmetsp:Transcript_66046/g.157936  ORF Transcript_66046/g.157936 Transcript_66046/m.157936 type:complete len:357 (-) Transcript_66046:112-1182(-)